MNIQSAADCFQEGFLGGPEAKQRERHLRRKQRLNQVLFGLGANHLDKIAEAVEVPEILQVHPDGPVGCDRDQGTVAAMRYVELD
jgi:hypothetical protein